MRSLSSGLSITERMARSKVPERNFLVRLKAPRFPFHLVRATSAEIQGEYLVSLNSDGRLAALFPMEIVESWNEISETL
jgi:hypothetical protein